VSQIFLELILNSFHLTCCVWKIGSASIGMVCDVLMHTGCIYRPTAMSHCQLWTVTRRRRGSEQRSIWWLLAGSGGKRASCWLPVRCVSEPLCLTNEALRYEGVWESGGIDPRFLHVGSSRRWVGSFTPRPVYPRGKNPSYPLDTRLGGPQSQSGRCGEEKILDPSRTRNPTPQSSSP
jgi:hypothetical protein